MPDPTAPVALLRLAGQGRPQLVLENIETALILRMVFHLPLRQGEGFL